MSRLVAYVAALVALPVWAHAEGGVDPEIREGLAVGEALFVPHLEVRLRGEARGNPVDVGVVAPPPSMPRADRAGGVLSRVRLGIDAEISVFRVRTNLQDARVFGGPDGGAVLGDPGSPSTGLYEGYLEAHAKQHRESYVRAGRQVVQWGEGRLLGSQDWSVRGRSLDSLRARADLGKRWHLDALGALLAAPTPGGVPLGQSFGAPESGRALFGGLVGLDVHPLLRFELLGLGRITDGAAVGASSLAQIHAKSQIATGSVRVFGDYAGMAYSLEGALQGGSADLPSGRVPVLAYAAAARVSRRFDFVRLAPEPELGFSYASGDARGSAKYTQFDPILPNPIAYSLMDVATWSNSLAVHAALTAHVSETLALTPTYRYLGFASNSGDWIGGTLQSISNVAGASRTLGHEIDLMARWTPHRVFEARAGAALLVLGQGGKERLPGASETVRPYALLQLQLKVD